MIEFKKHSGIYTLTVRQYLPINVDKAWSFFSSPTNLERITPAYMGFSITSGESQSMYPGQIITYRMAIFPGVKMNWVTAITHVADKQFFVDEQRFGPYAMWHHEHHFKPTGEGIMMTDKVSYKLPLGFLGKLMHPLLVKGQLRKIFDFRFDVLGQLFQNH